MKRTISIHIGGYVCNIDDDAYLRLEQWLNAVKKKFDNDPDGKEIIQDIEIGIAEHLIKMLVDSTSAVTIEHVQKAIEIMGEVSDFEDNDSTSNPTETLDEPESVAKSDKKLYRDLDNRYLGGVASGLAHYLGIQPVWLRLAFILTTAFFAGSGLIIYLLLLVMAQPARTRAEKLAMKGERVNIDNIKESVKEEFEYLKHRFGKFSNSEEFTDFKHRAQSFGINLADVFTRIFKVLAVIIGAIIVLATFAVLTAVLLFFFTDGWFFMPTNSVYFAEIEQVIPISGSILLGKIGLLLVIGVPIAGVMFGGLRMIFSFKPNHKFFGITGTLLWLTGLAFVIFSGTKIGENLRDESIIRQTYTINTPDSILYVKLNETNSEKNATRVRDFKELKITSFGKNSKIFGRPEFTINYTEDSLFTLQTERFARGSDRITAEKNAFSSEFNCNILDSTLTLDDYFSLPQNSKFSGQSISVTLNVPKNYKIHLDKNIDRFQGFIDFKTEEWHGDHPNRTWRMTEDGLELMN